MNASGQPVPRWVPRATLWLWLTGAGLWFTFQVVVSLRSLLIQLILALFFSFAMEPLVDRLNHYGISRGAATGITMLATLVAVLGFLTAMGTLLAEQLNQLVEDLPEYTTSLDQWLTQNFGVTIDDSIIMAQLQADEGASRYATSLANGLLEAGSSVVGVFFQILTISLFAFYLAADGPKLRAAICSVLPPERQREVLRGWELAINKTGAYLSSRLILAIISAIFHWIIFAIVDLPSPIALAIWVGLISQFIPVIGVYLAGVLPTLIALGIDPTSALWVIAAITLYQQIENYVLQPRITAQTLDMHPAIAFGAVLVGASLFGATGAVLALPFLATVQSFLSVYVNRHEVIANSLIDGSGDNGNGAVKPSNPGPRSVQESDDATKPSPDSDKQDGKLPVVGSNESDDR